jgi:hypothetical protein
MDLLDPNSNSGRKTMPRRLVLAGLLVLLAISTVLAAGGGTLPFVTDHDRGLAEAKRTGKAVFVYFTADW